MYNQILLPTDGSEGAALALDHLLDIATAHDATIHIVHVADTARESLVQIQADVVDVLEEEALTEAGETAS